MLRYAQGYRRLYRFGAAARSPIRSARLLKEWKGGHSVRPEGAGARPWVPLAHIDSCLISCCPPPVPAGGARPAGHRPARRGPSGRQQPDISPTSMPALEKELIERKQTSSTPCELGGINPRGSLRATWMLGKEEVTCARCFRGGATQAAAHPRSSRTRAKGQTPYQSAIPNERSEYEIQSTEGQLQTLGHDRLAPAGARPGGRRAG